MNRRTLRLLVALCAACSSLLSTTFAQDSTVSPISTERPAAGYFPDVIPGRSLQIENSSGDLPESFLRLGFFDRFELRDQASNTLYSSQLTPILSQWQTANTQVSGKLLVGHPNQLVPRSAVLSLNVPTGGVSRTSGRYDPGAALIWTQSPSHGWFINEVAVATLTTLNGASRPLWAPSIVTGNAVNPKVTLFAECVPDVLQNGSTTWFADGGFTFLPRATQQVDFRSG